MKCVNVLQVDVDGLKNGKYHPNTVGFHYCHKVMAKYQEWGGTGCSVFNIVYPVELK